MKKCICFLLAASLMLGMTSCAAVPKEESSGDSSLILSTDDSSLSESDSSVSSEPPSDSSVPSESEESSSSDSSPESNPASGKPTTKPTEKPSTSKPTPPKPAPSKPVVKPPVPSDQAPPIPKPDSSTEKPASGVSASEVYDAMDQAVAKLHKGVDAAIMSMPLAIDDNVLKDVYSLSMDDIASYKGSYAGSMTNCDILLVVEAKSGKIDAVKAALEARQAAQKKQFEWYGVMGNIERLEASKVVTNGNFAALIMVGVLGDEEENYDCAKDSGAAGSAFNNALKKK